MSNDFNSAMRRASKLVQAGDPAGATEMIQKALAKGGLSSPSGSLKPAMNSFDGAKVGRSLRETLASLGPLPTSGIPSADVTEPPLPQGARFDGGTFTCAQGSRDYRVYIPDLKGAAAKGLIMMLHGCTQSPVDFAKGTGMNGLADQHGVIVVYPAQSRGANMQSCWNWFGPADQMREAGEPAILAGLALQMLRDHAIPQGACFVAGLSAGAAMAVILGQTHADVFSAVGAHSGLPYRAAHDVPSAFAAMGSGGARGQKTQPIPTIVFHGDADSTVHHTNGRGIAEAAATGPQVVDDGTAGKRSFARNTVLSPDGHPVMEHWTIAGLGHAWSGGNVTGSYTDPNGPDASAEMMRFFLSLPLKDV
jgi:poly(hydroxyalkanoate) depolymerase family esterase